ncbi:CoA pyrophosphatase [Rhodopseudomonas palustris]|nr:CoA pyrophosphatase [Rhodopseudomonas palustris]
MSHAHDDATRALIAARCAAFPRHDDGLSPAGLKRAAVAIALVAMEDGSAAFLLTRRSPRLRSHAYQWALPGGRCDAGETAPETALRELHEELGLALHAGDVLGILDDYPTRSGYLVTPVVAWAAGAGPLAPNPDEVASVHHVGLAEIAPPDVFDFTSIPESDRRVVRFRYEDDFIHAPTAALIYQFREVLAGRVTRVADLEQPVFAWK